jgi:hypothetical protein
MIHMTKKGVHPRGGAQSGRNTIERMNEHPVTSKLITITTYLKNTIDKVQAGHGSEVV